MPERRGTLGGWGVALPSILLAAFVLRLASALLWTPAPEADAADYQRLAQSLLQGEGFTDAAGRPSSWRPPLYPGLLAAIYAVVDHPAAVRLFQAFVGTLTVGLTYLLGNRYLGTPAALAAAAIVALDPAQVFGVSLLLSETVFAFLLLAATLLVSRAVSRGPSDRAGSGRGDAQRESRGTAHAAGTALAAGVLLGVATLTRSALLLYPLALAPVWLWAEKGRRPALLLVLVGFALALAPWTVRNHRVHDAFVPVATQGGVTLYAGNHPVDGWKFGFIPQDEHTRAAAQLSEPEASSYMVRATVESLAARPGELPRLAALKLAFFWIPLDWELTPWDGVLNPVYGFALLWATVFGVGWLRSPGRTAMLRRAWPLWLPVAYFLVIALGFYGSPRFRHPVDPLIALAAGAALAAAVERWGRVRAVTVAAASAAFLLTAALALEPAKRVARGILGA